MSLAQGELLRATQDAVQDEVNKRMNTTRDAASVLHEAPRPSTSPARDLPTAARPSLFRAFMNIPPAPHRHSLFPVIRGRRI